MSEIKLLNENYRDFPSVELAMSEPNGLLAVGGDLDQERLVHAYRAGIFPWNEDNQPILWWSPNPRCVLFPEQLRVSKSLRKTLRQERFTVSFDRAFAKVVDACAAERKNNQGTWITSEIKTAFIGLYESGLGHSVETWYQGELVGGLYGIAMGSIFFGESMFSRKSDASKVALYYLVEKLKRLNFTLIDCQVYNPHLESLGAECIPRQHFVNHLERHIASPYASLWQ